MKNSLISLLALFVSAVPAYAAAATTVRVELPKSAVTVGSVFSVRVLLETDQLVNAYSVTLGFQGPLNFLNANGANSIIKIWQSSPRVISGNKIDITGGSIAPFKGRGELLTLNFRAIATGTALLTFPSAYVYLADGKGTRIVPVLRSARFSVLPGTSKIPNGIPPTLKEVGGAISPRIEFLALIADPLNTDQKLLGFSAADGDSGIKGVEARYRTGLFWTPWASIQNPAPVPRSAWQINFRVIDNEGNVAEQFVYDWGPLEVPGIVLALIVVGAFVIIRRQRSGARYDRRKK